MPKVRVIKRKDGVIQTQHRADERYDDTTLPAGTSPADVAEAVVVEPAALADVADTQAQLDVANGRLVKDATKKALHEAAVERRSAAEAVLTDLDKDAAVPPAVKRYLVALRDAVGTHAATPPRAAPSQPPAPPRGRR